jgi:hypothetical protein
MLEITGAGGSATRTFTDGAPDHPRIVEVLQRHGVTLAP